MLKHLDVPFRRQLLEAKAAAVLRRHAQHDGWLPSLPIPIDDILERTEDLQIEWSDLANLGDGVLGCLHPEQRLIRLNESYLSTFEDCPGLERFTMAHELAHWEVHVSKEVLQHPTLFPVDKDGFVCRDGDRRPSEVSADIFASYLLMPHDLMADWIERGDVQSESGFRQLARAIGVSQKALHVRLEVMRRPHFWYE